MTDDRKPRKGPVISHRSSVICSMDHARRRGEVTGHLYDPDCIFCKIVDHQAPASVILETDEVMAFLDAHPVNKGHVLLVPKAHYADLAGLPEGLAGHAGSLLPMLCRAVRKATGADGFNVVVNSGRAAGQ